MNALDRVLENETGSTSETGRALPFLHRLRQRVLQRPGLDGIALAVFVVVAGMTLVPVAAEAGWPANHEFSSFFTRTAIYAEHMRQGDLLPIWSSADNGGFGSPQPALYHKLFYLLAGSLLVVIGHLKASMLIAIWIWLVIGASCTSWAGAMT